MSVHCVMKGGGWAVNGTSLAPSRRVGHFPTTLPTPATSNPSIDDIRFLLTIAFLSLTMHCHEKLVLCKFLLARISLSSSKIFQSAERVNQTV